MQDMSGDSAGFQTIFKQPPVKSVDHCRTQNADIPQAGQNGAEHGGTAGRSTVERRSKAEDRQHKMSTGRFAQDKTAPCTLQTIKNDLLVVSLAA